MNYEEFSTAQETHAQLTGQAITSLIKHFDETMDDWDYSEPETILDRYITLRWNLERKRWVREYEEIMGKPYPDRVLG